MGGIAVVAPPKPTEAEVFARLREIGKNAKVSNPHTAWAVEDPSPNEKFYPNRSELDNICYPIPVGHFERYPFTLRHLESKSIAFYHYKDKDAAVQDALGRLARIGRSNDEGQAVKA